VVKIYAVRTQDSVTEEDVLDYCKANLTNYKRPKEVEFRKELPQTNVGKILRRKLREESA
jgi:long-chain acyl-CoA synthetase